MVTAEYTPRISVTNRGFKHLNRVPGDYGGHVRAYESSAAEEPCLWLNVEDHDGNEATIHLVASAAWELAQQLLWLLRNHYQGDATPELEGEQR